MKFPLTTSYLATEDLVTFTEETLNRNLHCEEILNGKLHSLSTL